MLKDSLQYNDHYLPRLSNSTFKNFVGLQDEVPYKSTTIQSTYFSANMDRNQVVCQRKLDSNFERISLFSAHTIKKKTPETINRNLERADWIFFSFIFCLGIMAWFFYRNSKRLTQLFKAFLTPRSTNQLLREGNILREVIVYPLLLIFFISITIFISILINKYFGVQYSIKLQGMILIILIAFFLLKVIFASIIGAIFKTDKETLEYLTNYFVFNIILGLAIVPAIFIAYYIEINMAKYLIIIVLVLSILVYLFRLYRNIIIGISSERYNLYYLFLYLCTVEILPYGVSFKLVYNFVEVGNLIRQ